MQTTSKVLMIRPVNFGFNEETASTNTFQKEERNIRVQDAALAEFDNLVQLLINLGIEVTVFEDTPKPHTPDSIFPNNWISFHEEGLLFLYPMFAPNRRKERKPELLRKITEKYNAFEITDYSHFEKENRFLEGTGSMVLDRESRIAYACLSPRTNAALLHDFCIKMRFKPVSFRAFNKDGVPVYHTNVMMCVAKQYVIICAESIKDEIEREKVISVILSSQKRIIFITISQMNHFAGNMLQLTNEKGEDFLIMSSQAYQSLSPEQISEIEQYNPIYHTSLDTIEKNGGGSARCMITEVFPVKR